MTFLARKVTPGKWKGPEWACETAIPADAFWDLRTTGNTLSFWRVDANSVVADTQASAPNAPVTVQQGEAPPPVAKADAPKKAVKRTELTADEEAAVTALLGTLETLDKIDVVFVRSDDLQCAKQNTNGATFIKGHAALHVDLVDLRHDSLVAAAAIIGRRIYAGETKRLTRAEVKLRLEEAHAKGIVDVAAMHEKIRSELGY